MKAQAYLDMMKRQQEMTDFPIAYAFSEKQLGYLSGLHYLRVWL